jgi:hypothetical protein
LRTTVECIVAIDAAAERVHTQARHSTTESSSRRLGTRSTEQPASHRRQP